VRFGNVINSHGSVVPLFERQIREHRYVTLTDLRMKRFFMSIREAAGLVVTSAIQSKSGATYVLDMGDLIKVKDVALCLIRSRGLRPEIDVDIDVVGKKPGEKVSEKLFTKAEMSKMMKTNIPNVWRMKLDSNKIKNVDDVLLDLIDLTRPNNSKKLYRFLCMVFYSLKK